ncbi:MAG: 16S rRNA (uracil(1498)-N(3))-methyltransferase [Lachnospiraceae bacterium]|jgi:16S rRNA (uracil1498-N3)-methyltransferase|nr:16S rRNA (uracil(1498)-N(3))-methyltransferase [Lachnospiraceae bacterium]
MYHFFTEPGFLTETEAVIMGTDVNHIRHVLRMKPGEQVVISDGRGMNRLCELTEIGEQQVRARVLPEEIADTELPVNVTLFQGLPKGDKMELIVQKCVELGVSCIVPLACSRCVVRLDQKKEEAKRRRWSGISESAAKQSKRTIVPEIAPAVSFEEAVEQLKGYDLALIPYEDSERLPGAGGMRLTRELLSGLLPGQSCAVLIGPEGGFSDGEVELAISGGARPVTLGKRILRTETAGLFILSAIGLMTEE